MCMIIVSCSIIYECCALPELLGTLLYDCVKLNQEGCQFHTSSWAKERLGSIDLCWTDKEIRFSQLFFRVPFHDFPLAIEYLRPLLYRAFWPHLLPSQYSARVTVTFVISHHLRPLKAAQTHMSWHLGLSTKTPIRLGQSREPGRTPAPAAPGHSHLYFQIRHPT